MSSDRTSFHSHLPAPCIVDSGTVVNKQDMRRVLCDLGPVRYRYTQGDRCISEGEGYVVEVFSDPNEATLVTNHSLYLNICSFDYLELSQITVTEPCSPPSDESSSLPSSSPVMTHPTSPKEGKKEGNANKSNVNKDNKIVTVPKQNACFKLVQENTVLQLVPLSNPLKSRRNCTSSVALDAVVADMLSTNLDISDDDDCFPF